MVKSKKKKELNFSNKTALININPPPRREQIFPNSKDEEKKKNSFLPKGKRKKTGKKRLNRDNRQKILEILYELSMRDISVARSPNNSNFDKDNSEDGSDSKVAKGKYVKTINNINRSASLNDGFEERISPIRRNKIGNSSKNLLSEEEEMKENVVEAKTQDLLINSAKKPKLKTDSKILLLPVIPGYISSFLSNNDLLNFTKAVPFISIIPSNRIVILPPESKGTDLKEIISLPGLKRLSISGYLSPFLNNLNVLNKLLDSTNLEYLELDSFSCYPNLSLTCLSSLTSLTELRIINSALRNVFFPYIPSLTTLFLDNSTGSQSLLDTMINLPKLATLSLKEYADEDLILFNLNFLTHLNIKYLDLTNCFIPAEDIVSNIKAISSLETLILNGCNRTISYQFMKELSKITILMDLRLKDTQLDVSNFALLSNLTNLKRLYLPNSINDDSLNVISNFTLLEVLCLFNGKINKNITNLKPVSNLINLRFLDLTAVENLTTETSKCISKLTNLNVLKIGESHIKADILNYLTTLTNLNKLEMTFMYNVGLYIDNLLKHKNLTDLNLANTHINKHCLEVISELTLLKSLNIGFNYEGGCINNDLIFLTKLTNLETLTMDNNHCIIYKGVAKLAGMNIKILSLKGCISIDDGIFDILDNFPCLKEINLTNCNITQGVLEMKILKYLSIRFLPRPKGVSMDLEDPYEEDSLDLSPFFDIDSD